MSEQSTAVEKACAVMDLAIKRIAFLEELRDVLQAENNELLERERFWRDKCAKAEVDNVALRTAPPSWPEWLVVPHNGNFVIAQTEEGYRGLVASCDASDKAWNRLVGALGCYDVAGLEGVVDHILERISKAEAEVPVKDIVSEELRHGDLDERGYVKDRDGQFWAYGELWINGDQMEKARAAGWEILREGFGGILHARKLA
jgi:hypothetical protein